MKHESTEVCSVETTNPVRFTAVPRAETIRSVSGAEPPRPKQQGKLFIPLILWFAVYSYPAVVVIRTTLDPDIWWHLRVGQWIATHGSVPSTDPFSSFGQGKSWVAYSWLFELLIHALYRGLGLAGIVLYRVAMVFAALVSIHRLVAKREFGLYTSAGLVGLAFLSLTEVMTERPWLVTILFCTLTLDLILDLRAGRNRRDLWLWPALFAVWANIHIQFIYGLLLLALACAAPLADRLPWFTEGSGSAASAGSREWRRLVALTMACLLATLLNPYHFHVYGVVIDYASSAGLNDLINEFKGPSFRAPGDWSLLVLALLASFSLGRRRHVSSFEVGLLIASAYLSFRSRRDVWVMVISALAILTSDACKQSFLLPAWSSLTRLRFLGLASCIVVLVAALGWECNVTNTCLEQSELFDYPAGAVAFVERQGYSGPLYNHFNWGGYLIWRLPRLPVSVDGRTNLHGEKRVIDGFNTWLGQPGWDTDPELTAARVVIGQAEKPLMSLLRRDPRFELVYEDPRALVFISRK